MMLRKEFGKKWIVVMSTLILSFVLQSGVQAATANPFTTKGEGWLPGKERRNRIVSCSEGKEGADYWSPYYSQKVRIAASSSNEKVAVAKAVASGDDGSYWGSMQVIRKGYGTTNIKVTVEVGGKTFEKTFKYSFYKYKNPFSSFKIGGKQYKAKLNTLKKGGLNEDKTDYSYAVKWKIPKGKLKYTLKKGYKILSMTAYPENKWPKKIKNNGKIPSGCSFVIIKYMNKKTKAIGNLYIEGKGN